jgi:hypothetical protein
MCIEFRLGIPSDLPKHPVECLVQIARRGLFYGEKFKVQSILQANTRLIGVMSFARYELRLASHDQGVVRAPPVGEGVATVRHRRLTVTFSMAAICMTI